MVTTDLALALFFVLVVLGLAGYLLSRRTRDTPLNTMPTRARFTGVPSIYNSYGRVSQPSVVSESNDGTGSVQGRLTGSGLFEMIFSFSRPMATAPKAVILSLALPADGMPPASYGASYTAYVDNITVNGFEVIGWSPGAQAANILFYYNIL